MRERFPWSTDAFDELLRASVGSYWRGRSKQARQQKSRGTKDAGTRGEVTGGQHLNAFAEILIKVICEAGVSKDAIHVSTPLVLPGYYRSQKKWDIVVSSGTRLQAAIELKSLSDSLRTIGP